MHTCTLFIVSQLPPKDLLAHVPHPIQPRMQLLHLDVSYSLSFNDAALVRLSFLHCRCFVLWVLFFPKCSSGNLFHRFISVFHFLILTHFHCFACSHFFVASIATKPSCRNTDPRCGVVPATPGTEGGQQPCVNRPRFVGVGKRMSLVV